MFPVLVSVYNPEDLKKVYDLLGDGPVAAPAAGTQTPPATGKGKGKAGTTAAPASAPATAAPTGLSAAGQQFLQSKIGPVLQELCLKDYAKAEEILKGYGVERASLVPEAKLQEFLDKVQAALDPGKAERERLEAVDRSKSLI